MEVYAVSDETTTVTPEDMTLPELKARLESWHEDTYKLKVRARRMVGGDLAVGEVLGEIYVASFRTNDSDGWFFKTYDWWWEKHGLTENRVRLAAKKLQALKIIEKKNGLGNRNYYRLIPAKLIEVLYPNKEPHEYNAEPRLNTRFDPDKPQDSFAESAEQNSGKRGSHIREEKENNEKNIVGEIKRFNGETGPTTEGYSKEDPKTADGLLPLEDHKAYSARLASGSSGVTSESDHDSYRPGPSRVAATPTPVPRPPSPNPHGEANANLLVGQAVAFFAYSLNNVLAYEAMSEDELVRCEREFTQLVQRGVERPMIRRVIQRMLWRWPFYHLFPTAAYSDVLKANESGMSDDELKRWATQRMDGDKAESHPKKTLRTYWIEKGEVLTFSYGEGWIRHCDLTPDDLRCRPDKVDYGKDYEFIDEEGQKWEVVDGTPCRKG